MCVFFSSFSAKYAIICFCINFHFSIPVFTCVGHQIFFLNSSNNMWHFTSNSFTRIWKILRGGKTDTVLLSMNDHCVFSYSTVTLVCYFDLFCLLSVCWEPWMFATFNTSYALPYIWYFCLHLLRVPKTQSDGWDSSHKTPTFLRFVSVFRPENEDLLSPS